MSAEHIVSLQSNTQFLLRRLPIILLHFPAFRETMVNAVCRQLKYKGRVISNAHSEISRKRDHVFKQMKVGSKIQYFSYKLTYLFFGIVALSFNTFFQHKTSLHMPSMKNSGVLCLIHDVTACFISSSEVK